MATAAELAILIMARDESSRTFATIEGRMRSLGKTAQTILRTGMLVGGAAIAGATVAAIKFANAAGNLEEAVNKANVTFGASTGLIEDFADGAANALGISQRAAFEYTATLGNILQASKLSRQESAEMSTKLVELAADMASFNNIPFDDALQKIRAGLVGEAEPLRTVGVLLSEAAVKTEAYSSGIAAQGAVLTEAEKVQARYNIILDQTQNAQGDFERTSDGLANSQRRLGAVWEDMQATLGAGLAPILADITSRLSNFLTAHEADIERFSELFSEKLAAGIEAAGKAFEDFQKKAQPAVDFIDKFADKKDILPIIIVLLAGVAAGFLAIAAAATISFIATNAALLGIPALIALVVAGVVLLARHWDSFGEAMERIKDVAVGAAKGILAGIRLYILPITAVVMAVMALLRGDWGKAWDEISSIPSQVLNRAQEAIGGALEALHGLFGGAFESIANTVIGIMEGMVQKIVDALNWVFGQINARIDDINKVLPEFMDIDGKIGSIDFGGFGRLGEEAAGGFLGGFSRLAVGIKAGIDKAVDIIQSVPWEKVGSDAGQAFAGGGGPGGGGGGGGAAGAIADILTDAQRWQAAGQELAEQLAIGLRTGSVDIEDALEDAFAFASVVPAAFFDSIQPMLAAIEAEANALDEVARITEEVIERGFVKVQDITRLLALGAVDAAKEFFDTMEGDSTRLARQMSEHMRRELAKVAAQFAQDFSDAIASIRDMAGSGVSGLVGAPSQESAQESLALAQLRLEEFEQMAIVLDEQAAKLLVIANFEAQIAELERQRTAENERLNAAIAEQEAIIEGIETQMDQVRAVVEAQLSVLKNQLTAAQASLKAIRDEGRAAIAEVNEQLRTARAEAAATIRAAEAAASQVRRSAEAAISSLEGELAALQRAFGEVFGPKERGLGDISTALEAARKRGDRVMAGILATELQAATAANLARQGEIQAEISAHEAQIAAAEAAAQAQIDAANEALRVAEEQAAVLTAMWEERIAQAEDRVDAIRTEMEMLRTGMEIVLSFLQRALDSAEGDLAALEDERDDYNEAVDAQVEAIQVLIQATEDYVSPAAAHLKAIQAQIDALERMADKRRIERELVAAQVLAANELLRTDAEIIQAIWDQEDAISQLATAYDILNNGILDSRDALVLFQLGFDQLAQQILDLIAAAQGAGGRQSAGSAAGAVSGVTRASKQTVYVQQVVVQGDPAAALESLGVKV